MAVGSFSAGLSGLNSNAQYLSVIGNNLANINTVGFKASSVTFMDQVSQAVGGGVGVNPSQIGLGVATGSITPVFSQGSIESTTEATNAAIRGNGFFVVANDDSVAYTRAGNFSFDADGVLVTPDGYRVQGYTATDPATGAILVGGQPGDIIVPPGVLRDPVATSQFETQTNLDAAAAAGSTFRTSVQVFDSLGARHVVTIEYTRTATGWDFAATVPGAEVGSPDPAVTIGAGQIAFDAQGQVASITPGTGTTGGGAAGSMSNVQFSSPAWANGAAPSALTWAVVDADGGVSLTGYADASATSVVRQNGSPAGMIDAISISPDGSIVATFGAGQTIALGQIALATFNNPKGLMKLGSNRYGESEAAGVANVGVAGTGGRGSVIGAALEQSNVDIAQEFTRMILAQRGYQANSKTITVSDELLVDTLNLKR